MVPLIKIKDPNFLTETAFIHFNTVKHEEIKANSANEEKYLEEGRLLGLQKIKEVYSQHLQELRRKKQEEQQKKKQE